MLHAQAELAKLKYIRCPEMITMESLKKMVQTMNRIIKLKNLPAGESDEVQLALDRFAQAMQIALATGMIHSSRGKFFRYILCFMEAL